VQLWLLLPGRDSVIETPDELPLSEYPSEVIG
jgi:hypothetical protein